VTAGYWKCRYAERSLETRCTPVGPRTIPRMTLSREVSVEEKTAEIQTGFSKQLWETKEFLKPQHLPTIHMPAVTCRRVIRVTFRT
jgi:hypothetical protein